MKFSNCFLLLLLCCLFSPSLTATAQTAAAAAPPTKILLIPLDDRPPCLQFPVRMGEIADAAVVTPPRALLGRFTEAGKPDEIIKWLGQQNLKSFDAAIISIDMLAYGGLVAMRVHQTDDRTALARLKFLRTLRRLAPQLKIYGSGVIMRLAPTGTGANEAYRENLAKWAEISADPNLREETARLAAKIPAAALKDYRAARKRDLKINRETVELVKNNTLDYLILSQDDAKPKGVHIADRENLIALVKKLRLDSKIAVQPGADEVSMLLLARALTDKYDFHPSVKVVYSDDAAAAQLMPFEDRPLSRTAGFDIKAVGAVETADESSADLLFDIYTSRLDKTRGTRFARQIAVQLNARRQVIVADIDPKGDVQGGDAALTDALGSLALLPQLNSYASWNTAGNTIGTTLPQGVIFALAKARLSASPSAARILTANHWFTFHRLLDDYYFHTVVRPSAKQFIAQNGWSALRLSDAATAEVEQYSSSLLNGSLERIFKTYFGASSAALPANLRCRQPAALDFDLPWNRTFEAEINFKLDCAFQNPSGSRRLATPSSVRP